MTTLAQLKEYSAPYSETKKVEWLRIDDGETLNIRFMNELDADSKNYDERRGLAHVALVHNGIGSDGWKKRAVCTLESEGKCWMCEHARTAPREEAGQYRPKRQFLVNVLVNGEVMVWSRGVGPKSQIVNTLVEYFEDAGSISNLTWRLKRTGSGKSTNYTLLPKREDEEPFDWGDNEPYDLTEIFRHVPYEEQAEFFGGAEEDSELTDWV